MESWFRSKPQKTQIEYFFHQGETKCNLLVENIDSMVITSLEVLDARHHNRTHCTMEYQLHYYCSLNFLRHKELSYIQNGSIRTNSSCDWLSIIR